MIDLLPAIFLKCAAQFSIKKGACIQTRRHISAKELATYMLAHWPQVGRSPPDIRGRLPGSLQGGVQKILALFREAASRIKI